MEKKVININLEKIMKIRKTKKAQGVFGMSFSMIFSIILIVFFIVSAFIAIRFFMNYQKCSEVGLFIDDLKTELATTINSEEATHYFNSTLPSGIQYVCFVNLTSEINNANSVEKDIFEYINDNGFSSASDNLYLYAPEKSYCNDLKWAKLKYIDTSWKNPICIKNIKGKISIKIERTFNNPLLVLS